MKSELEETKQFLRWFVMAAKKIQACIKVGVLTHAKSCTYRQKNKKGDELCSCGMSDIQFALKEYKKIENRMVAERDAAVSKTVPKGYEGSNPSHPA